MSLVSADTETVGVFAKFLCLFGVVVAEHIALRIFHPAHRVVKAVKSCVLYYLDGGSVVKSFAQYIGFG